MELSLEAMNLIMRMLEKDPHKRIHLSEVMGHAWITDNGEDLLPLTDYVMISITNHDINNALSSVDSLMMVQYNTIQ